MSLIVADFLLHCGFQHHILNCQKLEIVQCFFSKCFFFFLCYQLLVVTFAEMILSGATPFRE